MSIPTQAAVPALQEQGRTYVWARELVAYLTRHLSLFAWVTSAIIVVNGSNNDIDLKNGFFVRATGGSAPITVTGFKGGFAGRELILHNDTGQTMTIVSGSASSQVGNRITLPPGTPSASIFIARFIWSAKSNSWIVTSFL